MEDNTIRDYYKNQISLLNEKLLLLEKEISNLPAGDLSIYNNNGSDRWYVVANNTREYLPKKNKSIAIQLAKKKFLELQANSIKNTKRMYEYFLDYDDNTVESLEDFYQNTKFMELLQSNDDVDATILQWHTTNYKKNPNYPEHLSYKCPSGNVVRSKSEVFIDMALNKRSIPYRYECELVLDGNKYYPDFTFINPLTNKIYYWEHLGIMNNTEYAKSAFYKLRQYYRNGIIPGDNLILTFESKDNPFSASDAEAALAQIKL